MPLRSPEGSINFRPAENSGVHPLSRAQPAGVERVPRVLLQGLRGVVRAPWIARKQAQCLLGFGHFRGVSARAGPRHKTRLIDPIDAGESTQRETRRQSAQCREKTWLGRWGRRGECHLHLAPLLPNQADKIPTTYSRAHQWGWVPRREGTSLSDWSLGSR